MALGSRRSRGGFADGGYVNVNLAPGATPSGPLFGEYQGQYYPVTQRFTEATAQQGPSFLDYRFTGGPQSNTAYTGQLFGNAPTGAPTDTATGTPTGSTPTGSTSSPSPVSSSFIAANSSVAPPASTATALKGVPPVAQVAQAPRPYSSNVASVPVGGTSGAPTSQYLGAIDSNGIPIGTPPSPTTFSNPVGSILNPSVPASAPASVAAAAAASPSNASSNLAPMLGNQVAGATNQTAGSTQNFLNRGGMAGGGQAAPWYTRGESHGMNMQPQGLVKSSGAGRTDIHPISVPAGSYVLPADVVSGLGEGNTLAGSSVIDKMMSTMPYGIQEKKMGRGPGAPRAAPPRLPEGHPYGMTEGLPAGETHARGGKAKEKTPSNGLVPIIVAGGEHILYPQTIVQKFGSLQRGHAILDKFVLGARKQTIGDMRKLKGPKGAKS